jgi:hypothetical protein
MWLSHAELVPAGALGVRIPMGHGSGCPTDSWSLAGLQGWGSQQGMDLAWGWCPVWPEGWGYWQGGDLAVYEWWGFWQGWDAAVSCGAGAQKGSRCGDPGGAWIQSFHVELGPSRAGRTGIWVGHGSAVGLGPGMAPGAGIPVGNGSST